MKKSKILSFVLAIAMLMSLVPQAMVSAADEFNPVIWEEDFSTDNTYGGENATIVDGALKAGTGAGNGGFNFATLSAAVADAPLGQVRVKFDVKANVNGGGRAKVELKTNTNNVFLIDFGQYNILRPSDQSASYNDKVFSGNVWYTNDIILDFNTNKLIINVAETESGNALLTDFEYAYDLSAVTTITGIDVYGWGCFNDTYWDNFAIEYVVEEEEEPIIPDEPDFDPVIWEEDFSTGNTYGGENATIVDETLKAGTGAGNGGFNFATLTAAVADAPLGQVRVKFDVKANIGGGGRAKVELKTNTSNVFLIDFGQYNTLRPSDQNASYDNKVFSGNVWYTSDIVLDFDNNKLIINVAETESGNALLTDFEYAYDLSSVNTITGIDVYGWGGSNDTYWDNFAIEYVVEEEEEPIIPDEPDFDPVIWEEDFSTGNTYGGENATIVDETLKAGTGAGNGGFNFATLTAAVADAPLGQIRVKWDMKVQSQAGSVAKVELKTDAGNVFLINFGQYNELRPDTGGGNFNPQTLYDNDKWYTSDIVLDFNNNKLIMNVASVDGTDVRMADFEYAYDLSEVTTIKGIDVYGWNNAGDTYYDNMSIEYVVGEFDVDADSVSIYTNDYEEYIAGVAPGANKLVIDFGSAVKESTLGGAVTLTNVTDNNANVEFEGALSGKEYTMTFDGLLANKTYKLAISGDIENILGETIGYDYEMSFTTTSGDFKARLAGLTQNQATVENLAGLAAGAAAVSVEFEKTSPSAKDIKVLYAYYAGNKLEKITVNTVSIGEAETEGTKTDNVTIEDLTGITKVSIMLWEDLENIKPLCESIDL